VINLYDYLSDVMRLATNGNMLNFGYWDDADSPVQAQNNLCSIFGIMAQLNPGQKIVDVGSGYCSPAINWSQNYTPIDITCVNINSQQLRESDEKFNLTNATATSLPFEDRSVDRVLAFESAQHFKPLDDFVSESYRILKDDGLLALAIPVMTGDSSIPLAKLGLLSMTWSSEHYSKDHVLSALRKKFKIAQKKEIGSSVYEPLANYYTANREQIKQRISKQYPNYVEKILFKSINKMKAVSQSKVIDYLLITCQKQDEALEKELNS
jgi:ubiquinone/menaquinone biosynthesis C-methylase UbiE